MNSKNKNVLKSEITYSGARENDQGYLSSFKKKNAAEYKHKRHIHTRLGST